jgi:peptidoglycan/xylan/chitin deacetylase (PgdA/CDA1 family)
LVENHSYAHSKLTNVFTIPRLQADLTQAQGVIEQATGIAPRLFRPPIGLSNPRVFRVARLLNLSVVGWSAGGLDTQLTEPERIVARVARRLEPGAIILLHDGNIPAARLVATVKMLLDRLRALEYQVVRLDRMLT